MKKKDSSNFKIPYLSIPPKAEPILRRTLLSEHSPPGGFSGAQKDDCGKAPFHLLPSDAIEDVVWCLQDGADKYGNHNWRVGTHWSRYLSAALRHIFAWMRREDIDRSSGKPHLAHAVCCLLFLLEYGKHEIGTDDRTNDSTPDQVQT